MGPLELLDAGPALGEVTVDPARSGTPVVTSVVVLATRAHPVTDEFVLDLLACFRHLAPDVEFLVGGTLRLNQNEQWARRLDPTGSVRVVPWGRGSEARQTRRDLLPDAIARARGRVVVVLDRALSADPTLLPELASTVAGGRTDVAVDRTSTLRSSGPRSAHQRVPRPHRREVRRLAVREPAFACSKRALGEELEHGGPDGLLRRVLDRRDLTVELLWPGDLLSPDGSPDRPPVAKVQLRAVPEAWTWLPTDDPGPLAQPRSGWTVATLVLVAGFVAFETVRIMLSATGPSGNEGIAITAGLRNLQGHGLAAGFPAWLPGSPLWPTLAAVGHRLDGLEGARLTALVLVVLGAGGAIAATRLRFGPRVGFLTGVVLLAGAPTLALGRAAEVDALAVAGLGGALWCIARRSAPGHWGWVLGAAVLYGVATLGSYPAVVVLPWMVVLVALARPGRRMVDATVFVGAYLVVLAAAGLAARGQLAYFRQWRHTVDPTFAAPHLALVHLLAIEALPFVALAAVGILGAGRQRAFVAVSASALLVVPVVDLLSLVHADAGGEVVVGLLLAAPAAGLGLDWFLGAGPIGAVAVGVLALGLVALGLTQTVYVEHAVAHGPGVAVASRGLGAAAFHVTAVVGGPRS